LKIKKYELCFGNWVIIVKTIKNISINLNNAEIKYFLFSKFKFMMQGGDPVR